MKKAVIFYVFAHCGISSAADCTITGKNIVCNPGESYNPAVGGIPWRDFDNITINTTEPEKHGWVQYSNSGGVIDPENPGNLVVLFNNLNLNTTGTQADGLRTANFGPNIRINNLNITTLGASADGILMGRDGTNAKIKVLGQTTIEAQDGHGIRAVPSINGGVESNLHERIITISGPSKITVHGPGGFNTGYGVSAGLDERGCGFFGLPISACRSKSAGALIELLGTSDDTHQITTTGMGGRGIMANGKGTIKARNIEITNSGEGSTGIYAKRFKGSYYFDRNDSGESDYSGQVFLNGNVTINSTGKNSKAIYVDSYSDVNGSDANGKIAIITSFDPDSNSVVHDKKYKINGDLHATNSGIIDLHMGNESILNSKTISEKNGLINLNISGANSVWNLMGSSSFTKLNLSNKAALNASSDNFEIQGIVENKTGVIDLVGNKDVMDASKVVSLKINGDYYGGDTKSSNNGDLIINTIWNKDDSIFSDVLNINGIARGYTSVKTKRGLVGEVGNSENEKFSSAIITVSDAKNSTKNAFYGFADTKGAGRALLVQKDANTYVWHIDSKKSDNPEEPSEVLPSFKPEVSSFILMPKINMEAGYSMVGTLHERIGDDNRLSLNKNNKFWGRFIGDSNRLNGDYQFGYKSNSWGVQFGYDFDNMESPEGYTRNSGVMVTFLKNNLRFYDEKYVFFDTDIGSYKEMNYQSSSGKSDVFAIGAYSTYYMKNGGYFDFVGNFDYTKNKYDSSRIYRSYNDSYGLALSAEASKPYFLKNGNMNFLWAISPEFQIIYQYRGFDGFNTIHDIHVDQRKINGLRARLGGRLAKKSVDRKNEDFYLTANIIQDISNSDKAVDIGYDSVKEKTPRTWGEVGAGGQWAINSFSYMYVDARYKHSLTNKNGDYRGWRGTVGFKYIW